MTTSPKVSRTSWIIASLIVPAELVFTAPVRNFLLDIGILTYSQNDFFSFRSMGLTLGAFGVLALAILLVGWFRARRLGEIHTASLDPFADFLCTGSLIKHDGHKDKARYE